MSGLAGQSLELKYTVKHEALIYVAIFLNTLLSVMNSSMFNVALPTIMNVFIINPQHVALIVSSYSLTFVCSSMVYGKLTDLLSIKWLNAIGIALLGVGSLLGMSASTFEVLIIARIIQAIGASSITVLSIIITMRYIPHGRRGKRLAVLAAATTLGFGLGPVVGGVLTQFLGWEYLFLISLVTIVSIPIYFFSLPLEKIEKKPLDTIGMFLFIAGILLAMCSFTLSVFFVPFSLLVLIVFYYWSKNQQFPFIQPDLLKNYHFIMISILGFLMFFCNLSYVFLVPILLAEYFEVSNAAIIGLILFPGAICASFASIWAGKMVDKDYAEKVAFIGITLMILAGVLGAIFAQSSIQYIILFFSISSTGFVGITTSLVNILSKSLSKNQIVAGLGTLQVAQYMGNVIGVTIMGRLLTTFDSIAGYSEYFRYIFFILFLIAFGAIVVFSIYWRSSQKKISLS